MPRLMLAIVLPCAWALPLPAADDPPYVNGIVIKVDDGDTCDVKTSTGVVSIRFYGVDTPEHKRPGNDGWGEQPHASRSELFTRGLIEGERVTVKMQRRRVGNDLKWVSTYTRYVGEVFIDGNSVSRQLLSHGHAWWYKQFAEDDQDMERLAKKARAERRGLWSKDGESDFHPPWVWRGQNIGRN